MNIFSLQSLELPVTKVYIRTKQYLKVGSICQLYTLYSKFLIFYLPLLSTWETVTKPEKIPRLSRTGPIIDSRTTTFKANDLIKLPKLKIVQWLVHVNIVSNKKKLQYQISTTFDADRAQSLFEPIIQISHQIRFEIRITTISWVSNSSKTIRLQAVHKTGKHPI